MHVHVLWFGPRISGLPVSMLAMAVTDLIHLLQSCHLSTVVRFILRVQTFFHLCQFQIELLLKALVVTGQFSELLIDLVLH